MPTERRPQPLLRLLRPHRGLNRCHGRYPAGVARKAPGLRSAASVRSNNQLDLQAPFLHRVARLGAVRFNKVVASCEPFPGDEGVALASQKY